MSKRIAQIGVVLLTLMLATSAGARETELTGEEGEAQEEPAVDPRAVEIAKRALDRLAAARDFHFKAYVATDVVQASGQKLQFGSSHDVWVRRPNRAAGTYRGDDGRVRKTWYDGRSLTSYDAEENAYARVSAPDTLDAALDFIELEFDAPLPLADLLYSDPAHLEGAALEGGYVGIGHVGDWKCDHLAFRGEQMDWQIWVQRTGEPLVRKVVLTYREIPGAPQYGAVFMEWNLDVPKPDAFFSFTPPKDAQRIRRQRAARFSDESEEATQ